MFTMDNTEGFDRAELDMLNAALRILVDEDGMDENHATDRLNNAWGSGNHSVAALVSDVRRIANMPWPAWKA